MKDKKSKDFHILINKDSGGAQFLGRQKMQRLVDESNLYIQSFRFLKATNLIQTFSELNHSGEAVLVGGGDGTIKACAEIAVESGNGYGIIPLGTMNLLARDIGLSESIEDVLDSYAGDTDVRMLDVGTINDQVFLCCAGIGTIPEASEYREETRHLPNILAMPKLLSVILATMDKLKNQKLYLNIDGKIKKIRSSSLVVSNNNFNINPDNGIDGLRKEALTDGVLGVYSVSPKTLIDRFRILSRLVTGGWQKDSSVQTWQGKSVSINTHKARQLLSLDGEAMELPTPLEFRVMPSALPMLIPACADFSGSGERRAA